jgi:hypothetical protein
LGLGGDQAQARLEFDERLGRLPVVDDVLGERDQRARRRASGEHGQPGAHRVGLGEQDRRRAV